MKLISVVTVSIIWLLMVPSQFLGRDIVHASTIDGLCINERDFTSINTMDLTAIRVWLNSRGGFLKGTNPNGTPFTFTDVDGNPTNPAQEIFDSAILPYYDSGVTNQWLPGMNPQVLLTTLFKEKPTAFSLTQRPSDGTLRNLGGVKPPSPSARDQIRKAGVQLRRNFHARLSQCSATNNSWQVDTARQTGEPNPGDETNADGYPIPVFTENKVVATLYSYTPWVGPALGGGHAVYDTDPNASKGRGGNGYFCALWNQFGWEVPPPSTPTVGPNASPTLFCGNTTNKCVSLNVAGGTAPYQWVANKGTTTPTGNGRNVQLRPPTNSGSGLGGWAYSRGGASKSCGNLSTVCTSGQSTQNCGAGFYARIFGCNDQLAAENVSIGWVCIDNKVGLSLPAQLCSDSAGVSRAIRGTCNINMTNCKHGSYTKSYTLVCSGTGVELFTDNTDLRAIVGTPSSCNPCGISMQGATVTVRDQNGAGTPVTVPVTVR